MVISIDAVTRGQTSTLLRLAVMLGNLQRWFDVIYARPAVQRRMNLLNRLRIDAGQLDAMVRNVIFGDARWRQSNS
ncbi:MAG: hypothetical protein OET44_05150 [Gammaproteobacteria bacterium]|nr:hypothetical protein [Gammaproteobacteria bacterium]